MRKTRIIEVLQAALLVSRAYAAEERRENEKARRGVLIGIARRKRLGMCPRCRERSAA